GRIIAVDHHEDRLEMAQRQAAEVVNFDREDAVKTIVEMTGGIGVDRAIDAVGVDAEHAHHGPASIAERAGSTLKAAVDAVRPAGKEQAHEHEWKSGDAPNLVLNWAVEALAKAGTMSIIGVYPPTQKDFPIGQAMNKNLTVKMGNCH